MSNKFTTDGTTLIMDGKPVTADELASLALLLTNVSNKGKPIICETDGRRFLSLSHAAQFYGVTVSSLSRHVNGKKSAKSVDGRTFRKLAA